MLITTRCTVIQNGVDCERFKKQENHARIRENYLKTLSSKRIIGSVSRLDPIKDLPNLLKATGILKQRGYPIYILHRWVGSEEQIDHLYRLAEELEISNQLISFGEYDPITHFYQCVDALILCSRGEGFPNVLGEAMASEVPCISTDVGDASMIVENYGIICSPGNSKEIADAIEKMFHKLDSNEFLGVSARQHILQEFNSQSMGRQLRSALWAVSTNGVHT